ncbi:MAG: zf-HC2 domain-containing protein, partial [Microbacterium sp.]
MSIDHDRFATWDAAYALGALSASDRSAYEAHLAQCPQCRAAVAELGPAVALLSRVSPEAADRIGDLPEGVDPVPVLAAARARRRARRR